MKKNYLAIIFILILIIGSFLRLYKLDNRPAHFDEGGGHAIGARALLERGEYIYNPDFHGPFLYHTTALAFYLFGMSDITLRITQALFGIATIAILWLLKDHIKIETLIIFSLLIALSPSLVYYSRFAVHDSYFVFFTTAVLVFLYLYSKTKEDKYFYLFSASFAFLFTVKENAYIFLASIGFYFFVEFILNLLKTKGNFLKRIKKNRYVNWILDNKKQIMFSFIIFLSIFAILYTSFFRYPKNFIIAIKEPFIHWFKKSTTEKGFFQPHSFYLRILEEYDIVIFIFGLLGIFTVIFSYNEYTRFTAIFAFVNLAAYLLMPYKEPNNVVHIVLPLAFSAAVFSEYIRNDLRKYVLVTVILLSIYSVYATWQTSFVRYSDEKNYLVYVQTVDDIKPMLKMIKEITDQKGKNISIVVNIPETEYPLSWYFRDYTNVQYFSEALGPAYWKNIRWSGDGKAIWDDIAHSGSMSVKIDGGTGTDGEWRQKIYITGEGYYNLSGWIKTKNIQPIDAWKYAKLYIRTDKNNDPDQIIAETESLIGTNDWTFVSTRFYVGPGNSVLWLTMPIGNWGKTKGEIWFDDISLNKDGSSENLIKNPSFEEGSNINEYSYADIIIVSESTGLAYSNLDGYYVNRYILRPGVNLAVYIKNN
ncbi:MAG: TIGR03663 family protein [Candidatus Aenigmatarchaeota archaeon]